MNNPDMDFEIWKQLRQKWTDLDASGHKLKIEFQLVSHPSEKNNVLAIDVVQHIDGKPVTETVQRNAGEAYGVLGIDGLPVEQLAEILKRMIDELRVRSDRHEGVVEISMSPTSPSSGESSGRFVAPDGSTQSPIVLNYQYYYVLSALKDQMAQTQGKAWSRVRASYYLDELDFQFDYS